MKNKIVFDGQHFNFVPRSANYKLGPMPTTFGPRSTCPSTCPLKGKGCYGSEGPMNLIWGRVDNRVTGAKWDIFLKRIQDEVERGRIWRYATVGDLPNVRENVIDVNRLQQLVNINRGRMGYTYSHYPIEKKPGVTEKMAEHNRKAVRMANDGGFIINISANSMEEADRLSSFGLPVVTLLKRGSVQKVFKTPEGRHGIICPAQTQETMTCLKCKLCARQERASNAPGTPGNPIIGFEAHGSRVRMVETMIEQNSKECEV